jgi:hypothetical protein
MDADRTELNDLSAREPERAKMLVDAWSAWAKRVGVQSWPVSRPGPKKPDKSE